RRGTKSTTLVLRHRNADLFRQRGGDLALQRQHVDEIPLDGGTPDLDLSSRVNQIDTHPDAFATVFAFGDRGRSFEDGINAELTGNLCDRSCAALEVHH